MIRVYPSSDKPSARQLTIAESGRKPRSPGPGLRAAWRLPNWRMPQETAMNTPTRTDSRRDTQADGRDGRTVGEAEDGPLDSIGKAIVAPVEGADEDADTNPDRPFEDLTRTLPQGRDAVRQPRQERRR
jgi:hypothetical protein